MLRVHFPHLPVYMCMHVHFPFKVLSVYTHTTNLKSTENSVLTETWHIDTYLLCFSLMHKLISVLVNFIIILSYKERLILIFCMPATYNKVMLT